MRELSDAERAAIEVQVGGVADEEKSAFWSGYRAGVAARDETAAGTLDHAVRALLIRSGFASHGNDGWVRDDEGCGTCYDTAWALERTDLSNLAQKYRSVRPEGPA